MARFLPLLLICLTLCGCSHKLDAASTPIPDAPASQEALPLTIRQTGQASGGALRSFPLDSSQVSGIRPLGNSLVVFSGGEKTALTLLSGKDLTAQSSLQLDFRLEPEDPSLCVYEDGLSYFDPQRRCTVMLTSALEEVSHIAAPRDLVGVPIYSQRRDILYYLTPEGLRAWDLNSGLRRRIKEMRFPAQALQGLFLQDTILQCQVTIDGHDRTLLISPETGRTLWEREGSITLSGREAWYALTYPSGLNQYHLWGEMDGMPQLFLPGDPGAECFFLEEQPGAVTVSRAPEGGCVLDYYDLSSGQRLSSLALAGAQYPAAIAGTPGGMLYLLTRDPQEGKAVLWAWDVSPGSALAIQDTAPYVFPWEATPDPAALAQCKAHAAALSQRYGIEIRIGEDAVQVQPWDFSLEPETQCAILERELTLLDQRLSQFPSHFLPDTASHFTSLKLCIVRSLSGTPESGSLAQATGAQFLNGKDAYLVIAGGRFSQQTLYHELCHVMETHIFACSGALDQWEKLNPQAITYRYQNLSNVTEAEDAWLSGENQAFIDAYSMTFPREDRARILEYAMLPGNRDLFQSWILQRKLTALCKGIREAYGLEDSPQRYPWEQYLHTPLAPRT